MEDSLLIVKDCRLHLEMMRALFAHDGRFGAILTARSGREALTLIHAHRPAAVITDIPLQELNGIDLTRQARECAARPRVVVVASVSNGNILREALRAGASGLLLESECRWDELIDAVTNHQPLERPMVSSSAAELIEQANECHGAGELFNMITSREREVLVLVAEGKSSKEIAHQMQLSVKTVDAHRQQMMRKLRCHSVAALTRLVMREGLVKL